jgi:membrane-associated tyrosine/threonine-specific cdc2-inhibitory kinase
MFGDFPLPDLNLDDDLCDSYPVMYLRSPSKNHQLTKAESRELFNLRGLELVSDVPLRCTSNSAVYIARTATEGRLWAVKIASNRRRTEDEFEKRAQLPNSPYLVDTVSICQIGGKSVLQMEFCCYGDISMHQFDEGSVWQMIGHIGRALHEIHNAGWMHLDVSPGNILRDDRHFKLSDFGTLTKKGAFREGCEGAGPYVSPEALTFPFGPHEVTGQTDIFSFGVVLLECMSGHAAPRGGSENYARLRRGEIRLGHRPYECACSEELRALANAMISVDPRDRPTARDLIERSLSHC